MTVHYMKSAGRSDLRCVAKVRKYGPRLTFTEAFVYNDKVETLVHSVGTFAVVGAKL